MHTNSSCIQTDMFSLSKNQSYRRSVFWSPSLSPLWQAESFFREMLQTRPTCEIKDRLFMDWSMGMVIHNQKIVQVLQSDSLTHIAANNQMNMVLSCSWTGSTTMKYSATYRGEFKYILEKIASPFSWQRGEISMKLTSGCQTDSLDNISEAASGHLHQLVGNHHQPICHGVHQIVLMDTKCCFQAKDSWILLQLGMWWSCQVTFRDELDMHLIHVLFRFEFFQHPNLAVFQAKVFLRINLRIWKMVPCSFWIYHWGG